MRIPDKTGLPRPHPILAKPATRINAQSPIDAIVHRLEEERRFTAEDAGSAEGRERNREGTATQGFRQDFCET